MLKIKSRYKPLYKKFVRLRKNIQNKKKVNLLKFTSKKWKNLNSFLSRQINRKKKNYRSYDLDSVFIKRFGNFHKRKFLLKLLNKQSFSLFYGSLKNKSLKKLISLSSRKGKIRKEYTKNHLLNKLESRLDTVLYRSHFVKSFREARYLLKHGHILLNGHKVTNCDYLLQKGDLIYVSPSIRNHIKNNLLSSNMWPIPPENIVLDYNLLNIIYLDNNQTNYFYNKFPFYINLDDIIRYYTKN